MFKLVNAGARTLRRSFTQIFNRSSRRLRGWRGKFACLWLFFLVLVAYRSSFSVLASPGRHHPSRVDWGTQTRASPSTLIKERDNTDTQGDFSSTSDSDSGSTTLGEPYLGNNAAGLTSSTLDISSQPQPTFSALEEIERINQRQAKDLSLTEVHSSEQNENLLQEEKTS